MAGLFVWGPMLPYPPGTSNKVFVLSGKIVGTNPKLKLPFGSLVSVLNSQIKTGTKGVKEDLRPATLAACATEFFGA